MIRQAVVGAAIAAALCIPAGASGHDLDANFSVSISGPSQIDLGNTVPPRFDYGVTVNYIGPQTGNSATTTVSVTISNLVNNPGIGGFGSFPADCNKYPTPPPASVGSTTSCDLTFNPGTTSVTFDFSVRPTGTTGTDATTVSLSTGATASLSTTFTRASTTTTTATTTTTPTTTTTETTPTPPAEQPAAPPTTVTQTFSDTGQSQSESVPLAPATDAVQIALSWPTSASSFDVTDIAIVDNGQVVARAPASIPKKLTVIKHRTPTSLSVSVKGIQHGKLRFKIVAKKLHGKASVKATIRQMKRR